MLHPVTAFVFIKGKTIVLFIKATEQLKLAVKDPGIIPALCTVLGSAKEAQVNDEFDIQYLNSSIAVMVRCEFVVEINLHKYFIY